jgi:hypothetical protein
MSKIEILEIPALVGRTIVEATYWSDNESMSLKLDNGDILQVSATMTDDVNCNIIVRWEIEHSLCSEGIHSWCDEVGRLPADTRCEWCGVEYGEVD